MEFEIPSQQCWDLRWLISLLVGKGRNIRKYKELQSPHSPHHFLKKEQKTVSKLVANSTLPLFFLGEVWNYKQKRQRKRCKKVAPGCNRQEGKERIEDLQRGKTGLTGVFAGGLADRTGRRESRFWLRIAVPPVWKQRCTAVKSLGAGITLLGKLGPALLLTNCVTLGN